MLEMATEKILLGELLVQKNFVSQAVVQECLQMQEVCQQKLGEILLERNILSETQLDRVLQEQRWRRAGLWIID